MNRERSRSKGSSANLLEKVRAKVRRDFEKEKDIRQKFVKSSSDVGLDHPSIAQWEQFPINADGCVHLQGGGDVEASMRMEIDAFLQDDAENYGGRANQAWSSCLRRAYPFMRSWRIGDMLLALCLRVIYHRRLGHSCLQYVEFFCGKGELSKAAIELGLHGVSLDWCLNPEGHDCLTPEGLRVFLAVLSGCAPAALSWLGTQCSSFVVLCRAQSLRTETNMFEGDVSRSFVRVGNALASISALLMFISYMTLCVPVLEQPGNSCLPSCGVMRCVLHHIQAYRVMTYHGSFGAETIKPLQIISTSPRISALIRPRPTVTVTDDDGKEGLVTRSEDGAFTGNKQNLESSQAYTRQFGLAVVRALFFPE